MENLAPKLNKKEEEEEEEEKGWGQWRNLFDEELEKYCLILTTVNVSNADDDDDDDDDDNDDDDDDNDYDDVEYGSKLVPLYMDDFYIK
ncbi:hypothetical protein M0804_014753 [Polistes exclamans]|nr:hypothetical protein M0804_014756 [Polistes exclamans]KAI4474621.1 hypothetical protein M0804_014753 [Polistes exclamans]